MKPRTIFSTLLLAVCATSAYAQQLSEPAKESKKQKWVVGLSAGNSLMRNPLFSQFEGDGKLSEYSVGLNAKLFARYFISDNFALETGIEGTYFLSKKYEFQNYDRRISFMTLEVPIEFQYHFFSSNSKFRPYVGIGASIYHNISRYREDYDTPNSSGINNSTSIYHHTDYLPFSFTQGFTYQITDRLQLNQSLKFRLDLGSRVNFNFGVGYTIGKKQK